MIAPRMETIIKVYENGNKIYFILIVIIFFNVRIFVLRVIISSFFYVEILKINIQLKSHFSHKIWAILMLKWSSNDKKLDFQDLICHLAYHLIINNMILSTSYSTVIYIIYTLIHTCYLPLPFLVSQNFVKIGDILCFFPPDLTDFCGRKNVQTAFNPPSPSIDKFCVRP